MGLADNSLRLVAGGDLTLVGGAIGSLLSPGDAGAGPLGIRPDPDTASFWANATPGFLQRLCPKSGRLLACLDVAALNDPPPERNARTASVAIPDLALSPNHILTLEQLSDPLLAIRTSAVRLWRRRGFVVSCGTSLGT